MSNFMTKGSRKAEVAERRQVKHHIKYMYKIMDEIKLIAKDIHKSGVEWTEDNIEDVASEFTELKIADMEKFLLLGNLQMLKDEAESDNDK